MNVGEVLGRESVRWSIEWGLSGLCIKLVSPMINISTFLSPPLFPSLPPIYSTTFPGYLLYSILYAQ